MSEWRDLSRLPESSDYWLELRARIDRAAQPLLAPRRRHGWWLDVGLTSGVLASAAALVLLMLRPGTAPAAASLEASLAPASPIALELLNSRQPPDISRVLPAYAPQAQ